MTVEVIPSSSPKNHEWSWSPPRAEAGRVIAYYLSFADGTLPKGTQFLGAAFVEISGESDSRDVIVALAHPEDLNLALAVSKAHRLGINPGGEVMSVGPLDLDAEKAEPWLHRLLNREEAENVPDLSARP